MLTKKFIIRCFVSDPQTGVGFWDEFDLQSFSNEIFDFFQWYYDVLEFSGFCLDYWEVVSNG